MGDKQPDEGNKKEQDEGGSGGTAGSSTEVESIKRELAELRAAMSPPQTKSPASNESSADDKTGISAEVSRQLAKAEARKTAEQKERDLLQRLEAVEKRASEKPPAQKSRWTLFGRAD
jgi:hypothetical protein